MHRIIAVLAAAAVMATPGFSSAQQARSDRIEVVTTTASPRAMALARRYVQLMQTDQMEVFVRSMVETESSMTDDGLPAADRAVMQGVVTEVMVDAMPRLMDSMAPAIAETFPEEELAALIEFYETPMGQSIVRHTYKATPRMNAAILEAMPAIQDKLITRLCARYGCSPEELREMREEAASAFQPASSTRRK